MGDLASFIQEGEILGCEPVGNSVGKLVGVVGSVIPGPGGVVQVEVAS